MNFLNAMKKGKYIRLKSDIAMWERLNYTNFWFKVIELKKRDLDYWGISIEDILKTDREIKK